MDHYEFRTVASIEPFTRKGSSLSLWLPRKQQSLAEHRAKPKKRSILSLSNGVCSMTANAFPCIMIFFFNIFDGFHLYFFLFYFLFYSLFNLVNSIIALVPNTVEVEWQLKMLFVQLLCLFVSRVRLMECLLPDGHVRICSVPHRHDTPLPTPLRGHTLGC